MFRFWPTKQGNRSARSKSRSSRRRRSRAARLGRQLGGRWFESLEDRCMMATITPISFTAGGQELNNLALTSDADWLTYTDTVPHNTIYGGSFNPEFLKGLKVTFTGDQNNHLTKVIITGNETGTVTGPIQGTIEGNVTTAVVLEIAAPLGVGAATGQTTGILAGGVTAALEGTLAAELVATGNLVLGEVNPNVVDATNQVDIEWSLLDAIRRLPDATAIVPLSALAVTEILAIPTSIAASYAIKSGLGAPADLATLAALELALAALGISNAVAAAAGDVTIDVGDMNDRVDLSAFNHKATVMLGDGNDTLIMGQGNSIVHAGNGDDTFIHTLTNQNTTQTFDGGSGADVISVNGTIGDDFFTLSMRGPDLVLQYNEPGGSVPVVETVYRDIANNSIDTIAIAGGLGNDIFVIDVSGGPIPIRVELGGGGGDPTSGPGPDSTGENTIIVKGDPGVPIISNKLDFGSVPTFGGSQEVKIGAVTQKIFFDGFDTNSEFFQDELPGPLVIQSNYAAGTIVFGPSTESPDPDNPEFASIAVSIYGPIKFKNKTSLVYNGGAGGDGVLIHAKGLSQANPAMTSFIVNCGAGADTVEVDDTPGPLLHIVLNGGGGDDVLEGAADLHGGEGDDQLTGGDGNYVIDGGDGDDVQLIDGSDAVSLSFAANSLTLAIGAQTNIYQLTDLEHIALSTGGEDDDVVITNLKQYSGTLTTDLGDGFDKINYVSTTTNVLIRDYPFASFSGAPWPGGGFGLLALDNVSTKFANVEELSLGGSGQTVEYNAPDGGNTIHALGVGATTELRLDADTKVVLKNSPTRLNLHGLSGEDTFIIDPDAGTSITTIEVDGGDREGHNQLILNGRSIADSMTYAPGANIHAGTVKFNTIDVTFASIDELQLYGNEGTDTLLAKGTSGNDFIRFTPRINEVGGSIQVVAPILKYVPVQYEGIEDRTIDGLAGADVLSISSDDQPGVNSSACLVGGSTVTTFTFVCSQAMPTKFMHESMRTDSLRLELNKAVDRVEVTPGSGLPLAVNMGLGENTLVYNAANDADVMFDLDAEIISQSGYGNVSFTGTYVQIDANNRELTATHAGDDDVLTLQATGAKAGTFATNNSFGPTVEFTDTKALNLQGNGELMVLGSNFADSFNVVQAIDNEVDLDQSVKKGNAAAVGYVSTNAKGYSQVFVNGGRDADTFRIEVDQSLATSSTNTQSFSIDGGMGQDRLVIVDDDLGDTILRREEVDELSGFVKIGTLPAVVYGSLESVQLFPFDPVSGGTGDDLKGREVVLESDPLEPNDNRFAAHEFNTLDGVNRTPNIGVPGIDLFGDAVLGDEDWFRYQADETGTYRFALVFTLVGDLTNHQLTNGQPGLPDSGELDLIIYDAQGREIVDADDLPTIPLAGVSGDLNVLGSLLGKTVDAANVALAGQQRGPTGKIVDVGIEQGTTVYARVKGHTPKAVNGYDLLVLSPQEIADGAIPDLLRDAIIPRTATNFDDVANPPGGGLRINKVEINSFNPPDHYGADPMNPTVGTRAPRKIFPPATVADPTFQVESITVFLEDFPPRSAGFQYEAIHETIALQPGNYILEGAHSGPITIDAIEVINDPVVLGQTAKGRVTLRFNYPLPDDRYSLTIRDTLVDPAIRPLDGETNSLAPVQESEFKSGNGVPGGDFVGNFSVDTRVEIGTFFAGSFWIDLNQDGTFDPDNPDPTNRDVVYQFGTNDGLTDKPVIGDWDGDGFDEIGLYARDKNTGVYKFRLDRNSNGLFDPGSTANDDFAEFAFLPSGTVSANPVAADWNNDGFDDVGLLNSFNWILDLNGDKLLSSGETIPTNFEGLPFVGNWDGTFRTFPNGTTGPNMRLGTYNTSQETFYFDMNGDRRFDESLGDLKIKLGVPGIERPLVGDFDADFDTNIGLMITNVQSITPGLVTQWLLDLGGPRKNPLLDLTDTLDGRDDYDVKGSPGDGNFQPAPTGFPGQPLTYQDIFYEVGDARYLPFAGNFDLPATRITATPAAPLPVPVGPNVFHNYTKPADVDTSGTVTTADANAVYSFLIANGTRPVLPVNFAGLKLDVNNDQFISPQDFIAVQQVLSGGSPEDGFSLSSLAATAIGMYTNGLMPEDVNFDGIVGAVDALIIANEINDFGGNKPAMEVRFAGHFVDPSGDDLISAMDFLYVANYLASRAATAAGEGEMIGGPPELEASVVIEAVVQIDGKNESEENEVGAYPTYRPQNFQVTRAATAAATTRDIAITGLAPAATSTSNRLAPRGGSSATAPSLPTAAGRGRAIDTLLQAIESRSKTQASPPADKPVDVELDAILSDIAAEVGDHWQSSGSETR